MKMTEEINIKLQNCNNIDQAEIAIQKKSLNIKYGPNGLGKSTIAKAILASTEDDGDSLQKLMPFKHRNAKESPRPLIEGAESISKVNLFNDKFVNQFVFKQAEVVDGSFDIFIRTDEYKVAMSEIEELFKGIKKAFESDDEIDAAILDLKELISAFNFTSKGPLSKASKGYKALSNGNKMEDIPQNLQSFEAFLKSKTPAKWITWQKKGNEFLSLSENCPYCSSDLSGEGKKEKAEQVAKEYDPKAVENLSSLQSVIGKLGKYFTSSCNENLSQIIDGKTGLTDTAEAFIKNLHTEILVLINNLESLKNISFFQLRDVEVEEIEQHFKDLYIDLKLIDKMNSEETQKVVEPINKTLTELVAQIGTLKGKINRQKSQIKRIIKENQEQINGFLQSAGYRYEVRIVAEEDSYKMKLVHIDYNQHIENASEHLSYGEKNAFALILFMYQALSEKPDLIILDDPISSFDNNKKFAILHRLFKGRQGFIDMTILMLTHDIEPVIDIIYINGIRGLFQELNPSASFLSSCDGVVKELPILRDDIQIFSEVCKQSIKSTENNIIKAIYLRRYYEFFDNFGDGYNLLSSLIHGRQQPTTEGPNGPIMIPEKIKATEESIAKYIPGFQYSSVLSQIQDKQAIVESFKSANLGYEKIQLFRILYQDYPDNEENAVLTKFINETFHIENDYIMQLNPQKFDSMPEYIVKKCEEKLESMNFE